MLLSSTQKVIKKMNNPLTASEKIVIKSLEHLPYYLKRNEAPGEPDFSIYLTHYYNHDARNLLDIEVKTGIFTDRQIESLVLNKNRPVPLSLAIVVRGKTDYIIQYYCLQNTVLFHEHLPDINLSLSDLNPIENILQLMNKRTELEKEVAELEHKKADLKCQIENIRHTPLFTKEGIII